MRIKKAYEVKCKEYKGDVFVGIDVHSKSSAIAVLLEAA
jgi:hypothetical protein